MSGLPNTIEVYPYCGSYYCTAQSANGSCAIGVGLSQVTWYASAWTTYYVYVASTDNYTTGYFQLELFFGIAVVKRTGDQHLTRRFDSPADNNSSEPGSSGSGRGINDQCGKAESVPYVPWTAYSQSTYEADASLAGCSYGNQTNRLGRPWPHSSRRIVLSALWPVRAVVRVLQRGRQPVRDGKHVQLHVWAAQHHRDIPLLRQLVLHGAEVGSAREQQFRAAFFLVTFRWTRQRERVVRDKFRAGGGVVDAAAVVVLLRLRCRARRVHAWLLPARRVLQCVPRRITYSLMTEP